jgi:hypothetical protein
MTDLCTDLCESDFKRVKVRNVHVRTHSDRYIAVMTGLSDTVCSQNICPITEVAGDSVAELMLG